MRSQVALARLGGARGLAASTRSGPRMCAAARKCAHARMFCAWVARAVLNKGWGEGARGRSQIAGAQPPVCVAACVEAGVRRPWDHRKRAVRAHGDSMRESMRRLGIRACRPRHSDAAQHARAARQNRGASGGSCERRWNLARPSSGQEGHQEDGGGRARRERQRAVRCKERCARQLRRSVWRAGGGRGC